MTILSPDNNLQTLGKLRSYCWQDGGRGRYSLFMAVKMTFHMVEIAYLRHQRALTHTTFTTLENRSQCLFGDDLRLLKAFIFKGVASLPYKVPTLYTV